MRGLLLILLLFVTACTDRRTPPDNTEVIAYRELQKPPVLEEKSPEIEVLMPAMPVAPVMGLNTDVLTRDLILQLETQAQRVEREIKVLIEQLDDLRLKIAEVEGQPAERSRLPQPTVPDPEVDLPIKERPQPIVETLKKVLPEEAKKAEKTKTTQVSKTEGVFKVRTGVSKDKTRVVFDLNGSTKHTHNFDAEAGLLTITLPETQWNAAKSKTYKLDQLKGYEAKTEEGIVMVALSVANTSQVKTMTIGKTKSKAARLVIDLLSKM